VLHAAASRIIVESQVVIHRQAHTILILTLSEVSIPPATMTAFDERDEAKIPGPQETSAK
jgi:hypothetical protein